MMCKLTFWQKFCVFVRAIFVVVSRKVDKAKGHDNHGSFIGPRADEPAGKIHGHILYVPKHVTRISL